MVSLRSEGFFLIAASSGCLPRGSIPCLKKRRRSGTGGRNVGEGESLGLSYNRM
jgi:hypothetical protein